MCPIAMLGNIEVEIAPLSKQLSQNSRQLVHMFYADFAYYFDWQFIFYLYEIILKYIPYPLPKKHKNTYTLLQMCKKSKIWLGLRKIMCKT